MHAHIALTFLSCGANPKLRALRLRARLRLHRDIRQSPEARDLLPAQIPAEAPARSDTSRSCRSRSTACTASRKRPSKPAEQQERTSPGPSARSNRKTGRSRPQAGRVSLPPIANASAPTAKPARHSLAWLRLAIRSAMVEHSRSGAG